MCCGCRCLSASLSLVKQTPPSSRRQRQCAPLQQRCFLLGVCVFCVHVGEMALLRAALCFLLVFFATEVSGKLIVATLGDTVSFTFPARCASGGLKLMTRDNSRTVAELTHGVWTPGEDYRDRIRHISASEVALRRVNYNDEGTFEFMCGGSPVHLIQLETVRIYELKATEGGPLRLPCDSSTTGGADRKPVRWEKDGELVLELDPVSGVNRTRTSRLDVSEEAWRAEGDASGSLERVQPEDRGDYICSGYDQEGKRRRVALRVTVEETQLNTCPPHPSAPPTQAETGTWAIVAKIFITTTVILLIVMGVVCVCWLKKRGENAPHGSGDGGRASPERYNLTGPDPEAPTSNGLYVSFKTSGETSAVIV